MPEFFHILIIILNNKCLGLILYKFVTGQNQVDFRNWVLCLLWSDTLKILTYPLELINNVLFPALNISSTLSSYSREFQLAIVSSVEILALFGISVLADVAGYLIVTGV